MKKGFKKELEIELTGAINRILANHNLQAVEQSSKSIKKAGKAIAKKFTKTLKKLEKQHRKTVKNAVVKAPVATASSGKTVKAVKPSANGKSLHTSAMPELPKKSVRFHR
jgi:hypothetical protein